MNLYQQDFVTFFADQEKRLQAALDWNETMISVVPYGFTEAYSVHDWAEEGERLRKELAIVAVLKNKFTETK